MPVTTAQKSKPKVFNAIRRGGRVSKAEKALMKQFVADQSKEIDRSQTLALAKVMRRSPSMIKEMIQEAREDFVTSGQEYVTIHKQATQEALAAGEFEPALRGAQWALTNISAEGQRIVDKPESGPMGAKIMIGIKVGGINQDAITVGATND